MRYTIAALIVLSAAAGPAARQQPPSPAPPPLTPEQQQQISKMPAMGEDKRVKAEDIDRLMADGKVFFLDVREPKEIEELGSYEGFVNIPVTQLEKRLGELPKDKIILTAWNGGGRAARAAAILEKHGFKVAGFCGLRDYKGNKVKAVKKGVG